MVVVFNFFLGGMAFRGGAKGWGRHWLQIGFSCLIYHPIGRTVQSRMTFGSTEKQEKRYTLLLRGGRVLRGVRFDFGSTLFPSARRALFRAAARAESIWTPLMLERM